jgi:hypothetical protein
MMDFKNLAIKNYKKVFSKRDNVKHNVTSFILNLF